MPRDILNEGRSRPRPAGPRPPGGAGGACCTEPDKPQCPGGDEAKCVDGICVDQPLPDLCGSAELDCGKRPGTIPCEQGSKREGGKCDSAAAMCSNVEGPCCTEHGKPQCPGGDEAACIVGVGADQPLPESCRGANLQCCTEPGAQKGLEGLRCESGRCIVSAERCGNVAEACCKTGASCKSTPKCHRGKFDREKPAVKSGGRDQRCCRGHKCKSGSKCNCSNKCMRRRRLSLKQCGSLSTY
jgi:hypothetical protein